MGDALLDFGADQFIGPFLTLSIWSRSFLSLMVEGLGLFVGFIWSMPLLDLWSDPIDEVDAADTSSGFSIDFVLRAFIAFCKSSLGRLNIPSWFSLATWVAMSYKVWAASNSLGQRSTVRQKNNTKNKNTIKCNDYPVKPGPVMASTDTSKPLNS